jgi:sortase B
LNSRLRTALIVIAVVCFAVSLSFPIMRYFENKALDDEMNALRELKKQATVSASPDAPNAVGKPSAAPSDLANTDRSAALKTSEAQALPQTEGTGGSDHSRSADGDEVSGAEAAAEGSADVQEDFGYQRNSEEQTEVQPSEHGAKTIEPAAQAGAKGTKPATARTEAVHPEEGSTGFDGYPDGGSAGRDATGLDAGLSGAAAEKPPFVFDEDNILLEYKQVYAQNEDLIGWLRIEGAQIDHPVLQRKGDDEYYLTRDFYGKKNDNGQLILEAGCDPFEPSMNLVISGHNMKSGKMFGRLQRYASRDFGLKHAIIEFDTLFEKNRYALVAAFYTWDYAVREGGFRYNVDIRYKRELDSFLKQLDEHKLYDTGVSVEFGDQLIMLSTCSYQTDEGRFVVVARRIRPGEAL